MMLHYAYPHVAYKMAKAVCFMPGSPQRYVKYELSSTPYVYMAVLPIRMGTMTAKSRCLMNE